MTKREQIIEAISVKLKTMTSILSTKVYRSRQNPYSGSKFPYITIEPVVDIIDQNNFAYSDFDLEVNVSLFQSGPEPDKAADHIIEEIWQKIMSDLTLSGLAQDVRIKSLNYEFEDGEKNFVRATYAVQIKYRVMN